MDETDISAAVLSTLVGIAYKRVQLLDAIEHALTAGDTAMVVEMAKLLVAFEREQRAQAQSTRKREEPLL